MKKLLIVGAVLMFVPFTSFAQTATTNVVPETAATTITNPGLLPGDFFYFFDRWTEALNMALTFNKENKARKHLEYAKERIAEMGKVLENPTAKLEDVKSAKDDFDTQVADAAALVKSEKDSGADVADLARELDDELDASKSELKDILHGHQNDKSRAEAEIRAKIDAITASGTASTTSANELQGLTQALQSITKEKGDAMNEEDNIDEDLMDEQTLFEQVMGPQMAAEKHMEQALRFRDRMEQGLPADFATSSDRFMRDAQAAMKRGDFESAKRMSKDAERAMEKAREMRGGLEMGMPIAPGMMEGGMEDAGESNVNGLENEIQKGEKMMEGLNR